MITTLKPLPLPLTIIILTHRRDEAFLKALESSQFAQEVIVVAYDLPADWSGIKARYHFNLIKKPNLIADFAQERNTALKEATQPWVLFLDSDEVIRPQDIAVIETYLKQERFSGVYLKRQDFFYDQPLKWGETGAAYFLRLARTSELKFTRSVHEVGTVTGLTTHSSIILHHFPHPTITLFWQSISAYSRQEAITRFAQGYTFHLVELLLWPTGKFIWNYFFKLGMLDGWRGTIYALLMSVHSLAVRIYLYEKTFSSR